jgi:hypothetical protein
MKEKMTKNEIGQELWTKQAELFTKQRELIMYMSGLIPKEYQEDYNIRVNSINVILNECKRLQDELRNEKL